MSRQFSSEPRQFLAEGLRVTVRSALKKEITLQDLEAMPEEAWLALADNLMAHAAAVGIKIVQKEKVEQLGEQP